MFERRTKIVATLGPATDGPEALERVVAAGMDCARLNCSHGGTEDLLRRAREVREASVRSGRALGLMFDLQGPKIRLSDVTETRRLETGETVTFTGTSSATTAAAWWSTSPASPACAPTVRTS